MYIIMEAEMFDSVHQCEKNLREVFKAGRMFECRMLMSLLVEQIL